MLDNLKIYERFALCHSAVRSAQLAKIYGISRQTANSWKLGKNPIPWEYLKRLADKNALMLDWLLEGTGPQYREDRKSRRYTPLNHQAVNRRFLSLFSSMTQEEIGKALGVRQMSVYRWVHNLAPVPRNCLGHAVRNKNVTWEWLLTGRK